MRGLQCQFVYRVRRSLRGTERSPALRGTEPPPALRGTERSPALRCTEPPGALLGTERFPALRGTERSPALRCAERVGGPSPQNRLAALLAVRSQLWAGWPEPWKRRAIGPGLPGVLRTTAAAHGSDVVGTMVGMSPGRSHGGMGSVEAKRRKGLRGSAEGLCTMSRASRGLAGSGPSGHSAKLSCSWRGGGSWTGEPQDGLQGSPPCCRAASASWFGLEGPGYGVSRGWRLHVREVAGSNGSDFAR
jgi:hypothetical protein